MYILEQLVFGIVFAWRLQKRKLHVRQRISAVAVLILLAGLFAYISGSGGKEALYKGGVYTIYTILGSTLICSLTFILVTVLIYIQRDISVFEAIYAMTCAYLGEHIAYCLRVLLERVTGLPITNGRAWPLYLFVNILVAFLCYRLFAVTMIYRKHYTAPPMETVVLMLVSVLVIMELSTLAGTFGFQTVHAVYALVFSLFVLCAQLERQRALARQSEADIREQMLISQKAQYESYRVNTDLVNRKCHDLKHQVAALRMMGNSEQQERVIREIEDSVLFYDSFIKTGNEGLDTILTQKNLLCVEKEILFTCVADGKLLNFMDPVDLFVFFGNLMDNAIEAVQVLEPAQRSIQLSVTEKTGMVMIREENPTLNALQVEEGRAQTTKEDRDNHGFGLRSMEMAAEKYEGSLSFRVEDGVFILSAVFVP